MESKTTPGPPDEFADLHRIFDHSGLTLREAAPLFGVSPTSLNTWVKASSEGLPTGPHQATLRRVALRGFALLQRMVADKALPLPPETEQKDRKRLFGDLCRRYLQGGKK